MKKSKKYRVLHKEDKTYGDLTQGGLNIWRYKTRSNPIFCTEILERTIHVRYEGLDFLKFLPGFKIKIGICRQVWIIINFIRYVIDYSCKV